MSTLELGRVILNYSPNQGGSSGSDRGVAHVPYTGTLSTCYSCMCPHRRTGESTNGVENCGAPPSLIACPDVTDTDASGMGMGTCTTKPTNAGATTRTGEGPNKTWPY